MIIFRFVTQSMYFEATSTVAPAEDHHDHAHDHVDEIATHPESSAGWWVGSCAVTARPSLDPSKCDTYMFSCLAQKI